MPKLPENRKERESELLNKDNWSRGSLAKLKPVARPRNIKFPKKLVGILLITVFVLGGFYILVKDYYPDLFKRGHETKVTAQAFEYPFEVNEVKISGEMQRSKFLENFQKAANEKDIDTRYKYLEENFTFLLGFYNSTHSYDFRVQLEKFRAYMRKNYPKKAQANKTLYDFPCVDKLCGEVKSLPEVEAIRNDLLKNNKINLQVRDAIFLNFDAATVNTDKNLQVSAYVGSLSMMVSETKRTNDSDLRKSYLVLRDYIAKNYPEVIIPEDLRI